MKINCHLCGKHVDRIVLDCDPLSDDKIITVHCHGETDEMRLSQLNLIEMGRDMIQQISSGTGVAFQSTKENAPNL